MKSKNEIACVVIVSLLAGAPLLGSAPSRVVFERNAGQYVGVRDDEVVYLARAGQSVAGLGRSSVMWPDNVRLEFVNAATTAKVEGLEPLAGRTNYLKGRDPTQWLLGVTNFERVRYSGLYPGIDVVFHGNRGTLEYDFIVAPGANPSLIRLRFTGASRVSLDAAGNLSIATDRSSLKCRKPVAFQTLRGKRSAVEANYELLSGKDVRLRLGPYSRSSLLVIDPEIVFASYLGGRQGTDPLEPQDAGTAVGFDAAGMIYIAGFTYALDFPVKNSIDTPERFDNGLYYEDIFVSKIDPESGELIYSTIMGGSGTDIPYSIDVDESGGVYLAGRASTGFPYTGTLDPGCDRFSVRTAFTLKLSPQGDRIEYATCLCGWADARALALSNGKSVYVTGYFLGGDLAPGLPVMPDAFQATMPTTTRNKGFVVKLDSGGGLMYATWLAGNGVDTPVSVAADGEGGVVVLGATTSNTFPIVNALQPSNMSGGGINFSGSGGAAWEPRNTGLVVNAFTDIEAAPTSPGTLYASSMQSGVFVTSDFGQTWRLLRNSPPARQVAVSAQVPRLVYALTPVQLARSDDGGNTWQTLNPLNGFESATPQSVSADPESNDTVYIVTAEPPSSGGSTPRFRTLRSDNRGATWTEIAGEFRFVTLPKLVMDPTGSGSLYMVANAAYFHSTDRGVTWQRIEIGPIAGRSSIRLSLAVDSRTPGVLYIDALAPPDPGALGQTGSLLRSVDGGASWTACGTIAGGVPQWFWPDAVDGSAVYAATAEALYRSADSCATFNRQTTGLPGRYLNWATQDRSGNLYVATQPAEDLFLTRLTADGKGVFLTYLGTWESDIPAVVAVDPSGDIWVTGYSRSADWPTTESAFQKSRSGRAEDVFLTRLSAAGDSIVYSTYLGGSEAEGATALAITPAREVCVAGITYSADFPLANAIQDKLRMSDGFITCITAGDGRMSFATYLGGAGRDWINALKADRAGDLYVAGVTDSADLPSSSNACQPKFSGGKGEDAFVAKIRQSRQ